MTALCGVVALNQSTAREVPLGPAEESFNNLRQSRPRTCSEAVSRSCAWTAGHHNAPVDCKAAQKARPLAARLPGLHLGPPEPVGCGPDDTAWMVRRPRFLKLESVVV